MLRKHVFILGGSLLVSLGIMSLFFANQLIREGRRSVYASVKAVTDPSVVIVFGAGLRRNGEPSDVLRDRLKVAVDLYEAGKAPRILVSGDNRTKYHNEPDAMKKTLIDMGVPTEVIAVDYAGRRTYDTCIRAKTLWGVDKAILVSQGYHLPRAIWTCHELGIESTGISATLQSYRGELQFKTRELLAILKAYLDVHFLHPATVGGEFEEDLDGG